MTSFQQKKIVNLLRWRILDLNCELHMTNTKEKSTAELEAKTDCANNIDSAISYLEECRDALSDVHGKRLYEQACFAYNVISSIVHYASVHKDK